MDFEYSPKVKALQAKVQAFMESHVYPNQKRYKDEVASGDRWQPVGLVEELKKKARAEEL
jgi:acyl-CoA dehydrogenase